MKKRFGACNKTFVRFGPLFQLIHGVQTQRAPILTDDVFPTLYLVPDAIPNDASHLIALEVEG